MNNLPKLVKPYYSLEESYHRLKLAGAHLDKVNDVLLLGQNGLIEISLLCDEIAHLASIEWAKPIKSSREKLFNRELENCSNYYCSQEELDQYMNEIENADWVILADILALDSTDKTDEYHTYQGEDGINILIKYFQNLGIDTPDVLGSKDGVSNKTVPKISFWNGLFEPFLLKPLNIGFNWNNQNNMEGPRFEKSHWLATNQMGRLFERLVVVEIESEKFYVCKDMDFNPLTERVNLHMPAEIGGKYNPSYALDHDLVDKLINKENFVISKIDLQKFEQQHLGVNHEITLDKAPDYLDKSSIYYAEELDIAIQAHTAIFKDKYGNPHQSNSERIISWLSKHFPEQSKSEAFLKRIRTIVLPKK